MRPIEIERLHAYVDAVVAVFYEGKTKTLTSTRLRDLITRKNPYLFRVKNLTTPDQVIGEMLDALLSASEEKKFGDLLEALAIFVSEVTCDGRKSSAKGIDLEFDDNGTRYLVAIKSGPNWGNSSQHTALEASFKSALAIQRQAKSGLHVQAVLGMCYGATSGDRGLYIVRGGRFFWEFLSGDAALYITLMNLMGQSALYYGRTFETERSRLQAQLVDEFSKAFLTSSGEIDWQAVLRANSKLK